MVKLYPETTCNLTFTLPALGSREKTPGMIDCWRTYLLSLTVLALGLGSQAVGQDTKKFTLPDGYVPKLTPNQDRDPSSELILTWDDVQGAILYEVEIAEHYQEQILAAPAGITVSGDAVTGLGTAVTAGKFTAGSHFRIIGSSNGNDGIYRVSGEGLSPTGMKLLEANLQPETLDPAKAILLMIEAQQWEHYVKKDVLFSGQPNKVVFTGLLPGIPYLARLRATTATGGEIKDAVSAWSTPTIPSYTANALYNPIEGNFEEITTHSLKAVWSTPENTLGQEIEYLLAYSSDPEFKTDVKVLPRTSNNHHVIEDLAPQTPIHFQITPVPPKGRYSSYNQGDPIKISASTLPLQPIALLGTVSTTQSELGTLTTAWTKPQNLGNENISYTLEATTGEDPEFAKPFHKVEGLDANSYEVKDLEALASYLFRVQAFPASNNRTHSPSEPITGGGTTAGVTLDTPPSLEAEPGIGTLDITWSQPTNNLGKIEYQVLIQNVEASTDTVEITQTTKDTKWGPVPGLEKYTEYQISVTAIPAEGNKGDLPSKTATTIVRTLTDEPIPGEAPETEGNTPAPPPAQATSASSPTGAAQPSPQPAPAPTPESPPTPTPEPMVSPETESAPKPESVPAPPSPPSPQPEPEKESQPKPDTKFGNDKPNSRFKK